jgi:hypothetical protein
MGSTNLAGNYPLPSLVQPNIPLLATQKALRQQSQASTSSVLGSDVFASGTTGSIPPAFATVGGREVPNVPASPPHNPTPSAEVVLLEAEVEKSM